VTARPEQAATARPEQSAGPAEVEVIEEPAVEKSRHGSRRTAAPARAVGNPPTKAEAAKALRSAPKDEPPQREQQKSDRAEPPNTTAATAHALENNPARAESEAPKKGTRARERGQDNSATTPAAGQRSTETASRTTASGSTAPAQHSGTNAAPAEPRKDGGKSAGSAPSISWVNPPPETRR
jgi:hypothetical protein